MNKVSEQIGTETRQRVYNFLVEFMIKHGYAPSVREITDGVGLKSTSSVYAHLVHLETEGRIETKPHSPRAIKVVGYEYKKVED